MKILVVCDHGNNRSVTVAGRLKYWGHDVLAAGVKTSSRETLEILCEWADRIIYTDHDQFMPWASPLKCQLWNVGPDLYPRPYNKELLKIVNRLMDEHRTEYKLN